MSLVPVIVGATVPIAIAVVWFVMKPSMARKAAVREAVGRARAAAKDPNDLSAQLDLAQVLVDLGGQPDEALAILDRIEREKPNFWPPDKKPAKVVIGEAHVARGALDAGIEAFQRFVAAVPSYDTGGDKEKKWRLETFKVDCEQRIRLLKKGDTHVHAPEHWGDRDEA